MTRTLLEALQLRLPDSSKTTLRAILQSGRVRVNREGVRDAKRAVSDADSIEIASKSSRPHDPRFEILHEDDDLIVIDKSAGLLTVASNSEPTGNAEQLLNAYLGARKSNPRVHVVHRLDRDTSGVLVFAKSTWIRDRLQDRFALHDIERVYIAIVAGHPAGPRGTFRSFLAEDSEQKVRIVPPTEGAKEAITHYRILEAGRAFSLLEVTLETGRRNQIRVQFSEAGHPVAGDTMYGSGRNERLGRLGLHARDLGFLHPRSRSRLKFVAPVPACFGQFEL